MMKRAPFALLLCIAAVWLAACQEPVISERPTEGGLAPVEHAGMSMAQADPRADFASYHNVAIEPLGFSHLEVLDPGYDSARYQRFTLTEKDLVDLRRMYRDRVGAELARDSAFTLSDTAGAGTLRLVTELVRLEPNAPRERDERFPTSARSRTFTQGAGSMTLEAQLIDARTGQVVANLRDKLTDTELWSENNPVSNRAALERGFSEWGMKLRRQLLAFRAEPAGNR